MQIKIEIHSTVNYRNRTRVHSLILDLHILGPRTNQSIPSSLVMLIAPYPRDVKGSASSPSFFINNNFIFWRFYNCDSVGLPLKFKITSWPLRQEAQRTFLASYLTVGSRPGHIRHETGISLLDQPHIQVKCIGAFLPPGTGGSQSYFLLKEYSIQLTRTTRVEDSNCLGVR